MNIKTRVDKNVKRFCLGIVLFFLWSSISIGADAFRWNLGNATLILSDDGKSQLLKNDGVPVAQPGYAFSLTMRDGTKLYPLKVIPKNNRGTESVFDVAFENGAVATYHTTTDEGVVLFKLIALESCDEINECDVFMLAVPNDSSVSYWINTSTLADGLRVGVMTTSINVVPKSSSGVSRKDDQEGCFHSFKAIARVDADDPDSEVTKPVAEFCASSSRKKNDGWSVRGRVFENALDLSGCVGLRARIYGDGKGESFKVQLGGGSGHRDDYVAIDFEGWKVCELNAPALNDLTYDDVRNLYLYYNGLPADTTVRCLVDWIDVIFDDGSGNERVVRLEDFSSDVSPFWNDGDSILSAKSYARHKLFPASCAVVATPSEKWSKSVERLQKRAGVPSPKPGGGWRGDSPWIRQSYFFLTNFNVNEYEQALMIAKRGGFKQILLDQNSWCQSTGTYNVNEKNFPGGLSTLKEIAEKFKKEGIRFGLHLLGASVDLDDPYMIPVPDTRFVTDVSTTLAEDLGDDADSNTIKTSNDATCFPVGQDPYMGSGQVVRVDDELIEYARVEKDGLYGCRRGLYGTHIVRHGKGAPVVHFTRAYGYHMPDLNTDFIDEVAANFAKVANELPIDMVYFDGSELLQRPNERAEHWYYNARLHKAFYDKLKNKNLLFQGSSCSPYSWHMISRNASADGHDDLKAYLEERSGGFNRQHPESSYLDVGWYYAYDKNATPDMYEYCLGATIAYDASFSFQTSVRSAIPHPFIGEILDMIREYEELRLSGRLNEELCQLFELDKQLAGRKTVDERTAFLALRKEFHLEKTTDGKQQFRRVVYPVWQNAYAGKNDLGGTTFSDAREEDGAYVWELRVDAPSRVGLQVHFKSEGDESEHIKLVNPRASFSKVGEQQLVGTIATSCELTKGQFVFALPGLKETIYGLPISEPKVLDSKTPEIRLEPGVYRVTFKVDDGFDVPIRVRTPLYTDETYLISE